VPGTSGFDLSCDYMQEMAPVPGTDWSSDERAYIRQLEARCRSGGDLELEYSFTDAGDPCCVVYDRHEHRIVMHIARSDRRYVVMWPQRRRSVNTATMEAAVEIALAELVAMTN
jgi:hypothetical protein